MAMRKLVLVVALGALASAALVACGGGGDNETTTPTSQAGGGGGGGGGGQTLQLKADPNGGLSYQEKSLSAKTGGATIDLDNPAQIDHDVCVESPSGDQLGCSDIVAAGKTTLSVDLSQAGDYTFYCSVDQHRAAGMEGTLTVK
jgi:plastocyanin